MLNQTCCSDLPIPQALYQPGMVLLPRWTTEPMDSPNQPPTIIYKTAAKEIDRPKSQDNTPGRQFGPQVKQCTHRTLPNKTSEVSTMARTLPNKGSEVSKPLWTRLGHFWIMVWKCSVDTSKVLFGGVHRTLLNHYSEVSYTMISPFNPVSCRFHWFISSFSCAQMILQIYLFDYCMYLLWTRKALSRYNPRNKQEIQK